MIKRLCIFLLTFSSLQLFAITWGPPTDVSIANGNTPQIAVAANGNAAAVWVENLVGGAFSFCPAGSSTWTTPVSFSANGTTAFPVVDVDALGNATIVWRESNAGTNEIYAMRVPFGAAAMGVIRTLSAVNSETPAVL